MKAIQALSHRDLTGATPTFSTATESIDRALVLLAAGGLEFEPVDRCPGTCPFCDSATIRAA